MNYSKQILEMLGIEFLEDFKLKDVYGKEHIYYIDNYLNVMKKNKGAGDEFTDLLQDILSGNYTIIKMPKKPKLSEEEYKKAKALIELGYNWVARDFPNFLHFYEMMPRKEVEEWCSKEGGLAASWVNIGTDLFDFVNWEDDEPTDLRKLVKEYEEYSRTVE